MEYMTLMQIMFPCDFHTITSLQKTIFRIVLYYITCYYVTHSQPIYFYWTLIEFPIFIKFSLNGIYGSNADYVSLRFSHYHFTSKKIFRIVLYHILLYNTFTADLL